jgi:hypothetical protein
VSFDETMGNVRLVDIQPRLNTLIDLPRTITGEIDIRGNDPSAISSHYLHRNSSATFKTSTVIVSVPCKAQRNLWVYA